MNIRDAKICLVCDEIFDGKRCPRCGEIGEYISRWVAPSCPRPDAPPMIAASGN